MGHLTTFAKLYEELRLQCYHVALAVTKNPSLAEDAVHNAFLAVIKHKEEIFSLSNGKRRSKIFIITKNKAIDLLRHERRRAHEGMGEAADFADDFDISAAIEQREAMAYLTGRIAALPQKYKAAFELKYVHDMSNQEIAALLGITGKAVSTRVSRAKAMLRKGLANIYELYRLSQRHETQTRALFKFCGK